MVDALLGRSCLFSNQSEKGLAVQVQSQRVADVAFQWGADWKGKSRLKAVAEKLRAEGRQKSSITFDGSESNRRICAAGNRLQG